MRCMNVNKEMKLAHQFLYQQYITPSIFLPSLGRLAVSVKKSCKK